MIRSVTRVLGLAAGFVLIAVVLPGLSRAQTEGDAVDALADAVARFRGVGYADVPSYRVTVRLPEEEDEEATPLREVWRSPGDVALSAAEPGVPQAIVRGLAVYLEPLYVARASILAVDLSRSASRIRETCDVTGSAREVAIRSGDEPDAELPEELRELAHLEARIDAASRIETLALETREGDSIALRCEYGSEGFAPQPDLAVWTMPSGEVVRVTTSFLRREDRALPDWRRVEFPGRYDPGTTEEILVEYSDWDLAAEVSDADFTGPGVFLFDSGGLVED